MDCTKGNITRTGSLGKPVKMRQHKNERTTDFKKRFAEVMQSVRNNSYIEKTTITTRQIIESYIHQKHIDGITGARSYNRDKDTLKQLASCCENFIDKPIQKVTIKDIEEAKELIKKYKKTGIRQNVEFLIYGVSCRFVAFPSYYSVQHS